MTDRELYELMKTTIIRKQVDIDGSLQDGIKRVLKESGVLDGTKIRFMKSTDPRVAEIKWIASFLGESLMDMIVRARNSFPIDFVAIPTVHDGFVLMLEYKEVT